MQTDYYGCKWIKWEMLMGNGNEARIGYGHGYVKKIKKTINVTK